MIVNANDSKLKMDLATSIQSLWGSLDSNNVGIMQFFHGADAAVEKLTEGLGEIKLQTDEATKKIDRVQADEGTRPRLVAAGPKGFAFVGLRADLRELDEQVEGVGAQLGVTMA